MIKERIVRAYMFAKEKHKGQKRKFSTLAYFTHCKAVARILEDLHQDEYMVAAALLHDTVEDTDTTEKDIYDTFGKKVGDLVKEVTEDKEERGDRSKDEYLADKMKRMTERGLTLKLADRLHNVMFLDHDIGGKEDHSFIIYYTKHTRYILNSLKYSELTAVQKALYDRIMGILSYIDVKHYRK